MGTELDPMGIDDADVCATCGHYAYQHPCNCWSSRHGEMRIRLPFGWRLILLRRCRCKVAALPVHADLYAEDVARAVDHAAGYSTAEQKLIDNRRQR